VRSRRRRPTSRPSNGHGTERAGKVADYLTEVLWLLRVHHEGADELLYPLLEQRVPAHTELFARMEEQHALVPVAHLSCSDCHTRDTETITGEA